MVTELNKNGDGRGWGIDYNDCMIMFSIQGISLPVISTLRYQMKNQEVSWGPRKEKDNFERYFI